MSDGKVEIAALTTPVLCMADERETRFREFVARDLVRAHRLAWRLVGGDDAAAEDVVQDALVRAWRALPRFRGEAKLSTWFYRILVRQAHNYRRWRAVRDIFGATPADAVADGREAPGDPLLRRRIQSALARLSGRQRDAFVLVHWEGFTVVEAAAVVGCSDGTLRSHLHRARQSLRAELADLAPDGDGR